MPKEGSFKFEKESELIKKSMLPKDSTMDELGNVISYILALQEANEEVVEQVHAAAAAQDEFARRLLLSQGTHEAECDNLDTLSENWCHAQSDVTIKDFRFRDETKISLAQLEVQSIEELDESIRTIAGALAIGNMQD